MPDAAAVATRPSGIRTANTIQNAKSKRKHRSISAVPGSSTTTSSILIPPASRAISNVHHLSAPFQHQQHHHCSVRLHHLDNRRSRFSYFSPAMGKLNLLHHKSYHPYKADNIAKVQADEAKAKRIEEEGDRRSTLADSEARVDRLRKQVKKSQSRAGREEGEKELRQQLSHTTASASGSGTRIVTAGVDLGKERSGDVDSSGHINFWSEFESGGKTTSVNPAVALEKQLEREKLTDQTRTYISKGGEASDQGWYASRDGKSVAERKGGVEASLDRAYKDGEHKRLSDPLAVMSAYLDRRRDVLSNSVVHPRPSTGRERYAVPAVIERGDFSPVITSLLDPRRRRGDIPAPSSYSSATASTSSLVVTTARQPHGTSSAIGIEDEARARNTSERARAQALIASKRPPASSIASTVASEGRSWSGMYNARETREAKARSGWGWKEKRDGRGDESRRRY